MKMSALLVRPFAAAALFALAFAFAGPGAARADEAISPPEEEMVLVSAKTVQTLEQRVVFLEETVAALTESWQHIDTHRVCAADDKGVETCITKWQLDQLLAHTDQTVVAEPQWTPDPGTEPLEQPVTAPKSSVSEVEPPATVAEVSSPEADPETTGSVQPAVTGAAVLSFPHVEIYEEPAELTND